MSLLFIYFIFLLLYILLKVNISLFLSRYLDGFSVFEVGTDGLIHCHRLHKVIKSSSTSHPHFLNQHIFEILESLALAL